MKNGDDLLRRAQDLCERCEKSCTVTSTGFLTPAEQYALTAWAKGLSDCRLLLHGGHPDCERRAAFFLPYYMDAEGFEPDEYICAVKLKAGFGEPGHRDYLGAALGLGIKREWLGDIWVEGSEAVIFCLPSVERHLLDSMDKVGRFGVKTEKAALDELEAPKKQVKTVSFSVMSLRFDAVLAGMFKLSRSAAAARIAEGKASLNYAECLKADAQVKPGDVISLRGCGKGIVGAEGGQSRKGRVFLTAEILK